MNASERMMRRQRDLLQSILHDATLVESGSEQIGLYNVWHPVQASLRDIDAALRAVTSEVEYLADHLDQQKVTATSEEADVTDEEAGGEDISMNATPASMFVSPSYQRTKAHH
jgi:hypothetical protein